MNIPWIEKYRPREFNEVVGLNTEILKFNEIIKKPMEMPNLMFVGPQGTGKTSVVKIILDKLAPIDVKRINGSDTTGVDTIRNVVYNFITSMSTEPDKPKIVWIEEFDFMSDSAFAALRAMMEQYIKNARFIVTCNYPDKIPEPIRSRFAEFKFNPVASQDMYFKLEEIKNAERVTISHEALLKLVQKSRGDLRRAINTLQELSANELNIVSDKAVEELESLATRIYNLILNHDWSKIRYEIPQEYPDYDNLLVELDELFFQSDLPTYVKANINEIIAEGQFEMAFSFNKDICFAAIASRLIKELGRMKNA